MVNESLPIQESTDGPLTQLDWSTPSRIIDYSDRYYLFFLVQNHNNCSIVWSSEGSDWDLVVETNRPKPDRSSRHEFRKMSQIVVHGLLVKLVSRSVDYDGRIDEIAAVGGSSFQV
jgi:hypothetical protein